MPKRTLSIAAINDRLKPMGVQIEPRGGKLSLRASLPRKDGLPGSKQARIALDVGLDALSLEYAEAKALELAAAKAQHRFRWADWDRRLRVAASFSTADWIDRYRVRLEQRGLLKDPDAWRRYYWEVFKHLPLDRPLTESAILAVARLSEENSRTRRHNCTQLAELAELAGVTVDLSSYIGNYSPRRTAVRDLPTDEAIAQIRDAFTVGRTGRPAYRWQWVYGVLAAYGLRPHEIFFCSIESQQPYCCYVSEGKTGPREVYPFYPDWVEQWQLWDADKPVTRGATYWKIGNQVSASIGRYIHKNSVELWHEPYDLRHAYAIRGSARFSVPFQSMALFMGHTLDTHLRIYQKYLSKRDAKTLYLDRIARADAPKPP
jgi:hypothetical protein